VKKTPLEAYSRPRTAGINAITINEGDRILDVQLLAPNAEVILASRTGRAVRFNESEARSMGRAAAGVRGIRLEDVPGNRVVGMVCVSDPTQELLVVSENGFGKRSELEEFRITKRGGKGVRAMKITDKTGKLVAIKDVNDSDDLMIINKSGITIRLRISDLRVIGRATQGVRLIKISANDEISSVAKVEAEEKEDDAETTAVLVGEAGEAIAENGSVATAAVLADEDDADEDGADDADDEDELDEDDESDSDDDTELA
jgi:DNA gyrase subunit A